MSNEPGITMEIRTEKTTRATLTEREVKAAVCEWMHKKTKDHLWLQADVDIDCGCEYLRRVTVTMKEINQS